MRRRAFLLTASLLIGTAAFCGLARAERLPDILLVSVDTLRADRVSSYGYERNTSPRIDALLGDGLRFTQARTPTPLTSPAFASVMTSLPPHEHGSTRNGIRVRPNLAAFTSFLERRGYETAAFVSNWTLKGELSGLDEHFETYEAILSRKRWFGLAKAEATADDVNERALEWLSDREDDSPLFLWVHYVEPHAPYLLQEDFLEQVGLESAGKFAANKKYDTEVAFVDDRAGKFLDAAGEEIDMEDAMVVFVSDHGESLGEHGYWGHGRHLYEVTLHVPMGITWPGRISPGIIEEPASIMDLAPTILGLIGLPVPSHFQGFDWSAVLRGEATADAARVTWHQAHKASVQPKENVEKLRRRGLLEVGKVEQGKKEVYKVATGRLRLSDLLEDPGEKENLAPPGKRPSAELRAWLEDLETGLERADSLPPPSLTDDDMDALRALGYIE